MNLLIEYTLNYKCGLDGFIKHKLLKEIQKLMAFKILYGTVKINVVIIYSWHLD